MDDTFRKGLAFGSWAAGFGALTQLIDKGSWYLPLLWATTLGLIFAGPIIWFWPSLIKRLLEKSDDEWDVLHALNYLGTKAKWAYRFKERDEWLSQTEVKLRDHLPTSDWYFGGENLEISGIANSIIGTQGPDPRKVLERWRRPELV